MRLHRTPERSWADSPDVPGYTATATQPGAVMAMVREAAELGMLGDDVDVRWAWCSSLGIDVGTYSPWPATSRPLCLCKEDAL